LLLVARRHRVQRRRLHDVKAHLRPSSRPQH
jgi:hypothetical protein